MYKPEFPFKGKQIILSSDRIMLHSKADSVFLFGTQAVSLSSKKTINLDAIDKVSVYSPKIELGANADQPIILSKPFIDDLIVLLTGLEQVGTYLAQVSEGNPGVSALYISKAGKLINEISLLVKSNIGSEKNLSRITYTS